MKDFKNSFLLIIVFFAISIRIDAQTTVNCYLDTNALASGYVNQFSDKVDGFKNGPFGNVTNFGLGYTVNNYFIYWKFDISAIPPNSTIKSVYLVYTKLSGVNTPIFDALIRKLDVDPYTADGATIYSKIHTAPLHQYAKRPMGGDWKTTYAPIALDTIATIDMQYAINNGLNYFAIGMDQNSALWNQFFRLTNQYEKVDRNYVTITYTPNCKAVTFTAQPTSPAAQCSPASASFSVTAEGEGVISYQWQLSTDGGSVYNNITSEGSNPSYSGYNSTQLNSINCQASANNYMYRCIATNCSGSNIATSNAATINIYSSPIITYISPDKIKCSRDSALFKIVISPDISGQSALSFQWSKNGTDISNATNSTYFISNITSLNSGTYSCIVSNVCGNTSAAVSLFVNNSPFIQDTIPNQSACEGSNIILSFHAIGTNLIYQWAKGGAAIVGATNSAYSINNIKMGDGNIYTCTVSNSCDNKSLKPFVLSISQKPLISISPLLQTKNVGDSLTYSVSPTGTSPFSYQWMKDNVILIGKTVNPFKIKPITGSEGGFYSVVISNSCGSTSAMVGTLIVPCCNYSLSGYVKYDDKVQKPMTNTTVYLENSGSERIASTITDASGFYQFTNINSGTYKLVCETNYKWGGSSPTDALLINKYFVALYSFGDEMKKQAGDVNLDGKFNSTDALIINKRFVALITKFTAPDWIFESPTVIIGGNYVQQDIKAICTGDVDGSY